MKIEFAKRLQDLPPYLFVEIDKAKRQAMAEGRDVINLGVGDPDYPTHPHIIAAMQKAAADPGNHHYAFDAGLPALRQEIAVWFKKRFNVTLDSDKEIYPLIGSKEGLAHLPLGVINPGDVVALTDPSYPAYEPSIKFAGGQIIRVPMNPQEGFLPDIKKIEDVANLKMMIINYPNNPTAATAPLSFYKELVALALKKGFIIVSDMAYSEVYFDGIKPPSIFEVEGAMDCAIEFHSFSKTYYMTGWRLGWACGNQTLIAALGKIKTNCDSGIFTAIQVAGIAALKGDQSVVEDMRKLYQDRRDLVINNLKKAGWNITPPKAAFYVWAPIPKTFKTSMEAAKAFLDKADIVMTPGNGFGPSGEGYIRMALTVPEDRLLQAVERIKKVI